MQSSSRERRGIAFAPFFVAEAQAKRWLRAQVRNSSGHTPAGLPTARVMIVAISTRSLTEFYDCDLNGVSLGLLFAPILYLVANMIAVAGLAVLYYLMLLFVVRA